MIRTTAVVFAVLLALPMLGAECEDMAKLVVPDTTISSTEVRPAGEFVMPNGRRVRVTSEFCRVVGAIRPTADSDIRFEVWLPREGWSGKFLGIGNGGYAGTIGYAGLADAVSRGYASASTDTGHTATEDTSARWASGHPEKVIDFGYRAIHESAVTAKAIMAAYYGERPRRSYFNSCSNGGRQALMEAQRFPADYDGIIAGAPANDWTHLMASAAWEMQALLATPDSYIPAAKLPAIETAVLAACDSTDGVKDGVLDDPRRCRFDPGVLLCKEAETNLCLTAAQVEAVRKLYQGPRDASGKQVYPGYSPGGEAEAGGWGPWLTGAAPEKALMFGFSTQFFRNIVYEKPEWDWRTFDFTRDLQAAEEKAARHLDATSVDLREFQKRGGKLILYHGWNDAAIPAESTINYYESVRAKMGTRVADGFLRLYMVPGMQHCGGGAGVNNFGQGIVGHGDRQHDVEVALEAWVEQGSAPAALIATKYKKDSDPASGVVRRRPLCPYPQVARWDGKGNPDAAESFTCVNPAKN